MARCLVCGEFIDEVGVCDPCQAAQGVNRNWGGRRIPGPGKSLGRPPRPDKRRLKAFRIPVDLAELLEQEPDQTALIEKLLRAHYSPQ